MGRKERKGITGLTFSLKWYGHHQQHQNDHDHSPEHG